MHVQRLFSYRDGDSKIFSYFSYCSSWSSLNRRVDIKTIVAFNVSGIELFEHLQSPDTRLRTHNAAHERVIDTQKDLLVRILFLQRAPRSSPRLWHYELKLWSRGIWRVTTTVRFPAFWAVLATLYFTC